MEWSQGEFLVSDEKQKLDVAFIHRFLSENAYWSKGRTRETVEESIRNSHCFGLYQGDRQIGFARVITDYAVFAYLLDVFVLEEFRNHGAGRFMIECVMDHPRLQNIKWILKTTYAQSLYRRVGFQDFESAQGWMMKR